MKKLDGKSMDIVADNIAKLKEIFPDIFTDGKIDFEALRATLGEYVERDDERYSFTWNGKAKARRIAQTPSRGTLRPAKEESKDWDTTQNLYIEGDNLEVLKLLQKSYHKQVKMIYIDPPYNTGKDFVYRDNFKDNIKNYLEQTGQIDSEGKKLSTNRETSGRYHSDWLNMMYPRLKLARNLLKDDGVIFISIDDNEVANLRKICDEIFGEENFVANVIWQRAFSPKNDAKFLSENHDYVLIYTKNIDLFDIGRLPRSEEANARYKNLDNDPRGVWISDNLTVKTYSKKIQRKYNKVIDEEVLKATVESLMKIVLEALNCITGDGGVRNLHVHSEKFKDDELNWLSSTTFLANFHDEFKIQSEIAYETAKNKWQNTVENNNKELSKLIDIYFNTIYTIISIDDKVILPEEYTKTSNKSLEEERVTPASV